MLSSGLDILLNCPFAPALLFPDTVSSTSGKGHQDTCCNLSRSHSTARRSAPDSGKQVGLGWLND